MFFRRRKKPPRPETVLRAALAEAQASYPEEKMAARKLLRRIEAVVDAAAAEGAPDALLKHAAETCGRLQRSLLGRFGEGVVSRALGHRPKPATYRASVMPSPSDSAPASVRLTSVSSSAPPPSASQRRSLQCLRCKGRNLVELKIDQVGSQPSWSALGRRLTAHLCEGCDHVEWSAPKR